MKTLPRFFSNILYLSCLVAVVALLAPSAHSKKLPFKVIAADRSSILLDIKGYETLHKAKGWNSAYTKRYFWSRVLDENLSLNIVITELGRGMYWSNTVLSTEQLVRKYTTYHIERIIETSGNPEPNSFDSDQETSAIKFKILHPNYNFCYHIRRLVGFGDDTFGSSYNPSINLEICTLNDLNLSIKNPEKFFIVDDRNQKVRLDLSYQNLGQKIAALKTSTPSTANQSGNEKTRLEQKCLYGDTDSCRTLNKNRSPNSSFGKKFVTGAPSPAGPNKNQGALDRRSATVQKRLETLKNLETNGLISSEEARKKRQEILKDL